MEFKNILLILSVVVLLSSLIVVSANDTQYDKFDIQEILDTYNSSEMIGCCSVVLQKDGNDSMISFRRDADNAAEIFIENQSWHGKQVVKQYKTSNGYFCQVIVTNDGWLVGYGGIDDGPDNEKIENITGKMIENSTTINETTLQEIQAVKAAYGFGHALIKAPDGTYGIATADTYFTGKLKPGEYVSIPNRSNFFRSGNVTLNSTDLVKTMSELAISDGFGITRRDVTVMDFNCSEDANTTKVYVSNDDGSLWGMSTSGLRDNINMSGNYTKAEDIPIAPNYKYLGNFTFENNNTSDDGGPIGFVFHIILYAVAALIIAVVAFFSYHTIKVLRYRRRYRR